MMLIDRNCWDYKRLLDAIALKTKLDHVRDMFDDAIAGKNLPFRAVLMDSWYATKDLMVHIDKA